MRRFVAIGPAEHFPLGEGRCASVDNRRVAIFRLDDGFHAIDNLCLHHAGPLCEGEVEDGAVTCPWHGWAYDIRTGILVQDGRIGVTRHEIRVVDGIVEVLVKD